MSSRTHINTEERIIIIFVLNNVGFMSNRTDHINTEEIIIIIFVLNREIDI